MSLESGKDDGPRIASLILPSLALLPAFAGAWVINDPDLFLNQLGNGKTMDIALAGESMTVDRFGLQLLAGFVVVLGVGIAHFSFRGGKY